SLYNGETVLITFHPHPRKVLYPESAGKSLRLINTTDEKMLLLEKAGVDNVIIAEFTREFSRITCEEFVRDYLVSRIGARVIVVGFNHHFGCNRLGDYNYLWNLKDIYGFEAEEIPAREVEHETVSSTRIRKAISDGYIQRANAYLDNHYMILCFPEEARNIPAGDFNFFSAGKIDPDKLIPPGGIYAASVSFEASRHKCIVLIGENTDGENGVFFLTPGSDTDYKEKRIILYFHKRLSENLNLYDKNCFNTTVKKAIEEVSELIY
ncbi:MAG: hypothetical protein GYA43_10310, partial [Bacteroidales bacterium]|nr:hypothetical protein [Bacteroidales bacterium]